MLAQLAVRPLWPLLGVMFGGVWLSWPWFVFNGFAVGSPTRWRETGIVLFGFAGAALSVVGLGYLVGAGILPRGGIPYALLVVVVFKLAVSYWLHALQERTFGVYEYYGGLSKSGLPVVIVAYLVARGARPALLAYPGLHIVLS